MRIHNIRDYGAVGDSAVLDTRAIQRTIDACGPGETVLLPEGVYRSGALFLHSSMHFVVSEGATLLGSDNLADYPICPYAFEGRKGQSYASLLNTVDIRDTTPANPWYETGHITDGEKRLHDITIEGRGTITANGTVLMRKELAENRGFRGRALALRNVDGMVIRDVTVRHSPAWCVHLMFCTNVLVEGVTICTKYAPDGEKYDVFNGDGLDPDSCRDVTIRHCVIESQDDCIALKSGRDTWGREVGVPTENVLIEHCTFRYGFGVAMGSEMSGGIRNVTVRDCIYEDTYSLASVKAIRGRGSYIENITYERLRHVNNSLEHQDCRWFRGAIYIDQFYSHEEYDAQHPEPVTEETPVIRNIVLRDVESSTLAGNAIFLQGLPERHLSGITLENVRAKGKTGVTIINADGVTMKNVIAETIS